MKLHLWAAVLGVSSIGAWAGGAGAQTDDKPITDVDYLAGSIAHAACEATAGELAPTRAKADEVRKFARQVTADQGAFDSQLETLAVNHKVDLHANQASGRQACESRLSALQGDE